MTKPDGEQDILTIVAADRASLDSALDRLTEALGNTGPARQDLGPLAVDLHLAGGAGRDIIGSALSEVAVDWAFQQASKRGKRLFLADMDSTMISVECVDELAGYAGIKEQVAAITEQAMRGEIEFDSALRQRVALLKGMALDELERCYRERVRFTPGAQILVRTLMRDGVQTVLVSGGFTFFTERVAGGLGFGTHYANRLIDDGRALTGAVAEPLSNADTKLSKLNSYREALKLAPHETMAIGDGANDRPMIEAAGLGLAYRAKPVLKAAAGAAIDHTDLTTALYFLGYRREQFAA